jgi:hypothetical protein
LRIGAVTGLAAASHSRGDRHPGEPLSIRTPRKVGVHHHATLEALREPVFLALIMLLLAAAGWILFERSTDLPPLKQSGFELDIGSPTELPHYAPTFDAAGQLRVTDVEYFEDHGGTPDYFPYEGVSRHTSASALTGRSSETRPSKWCLNSRHPSATRTRPIAAQVAPSSRLN